MPVRLNSSGGGSVTLDVPSTGSAFNLTLPAANGNLGINLATAQNSTSGTFIDFPNIPAGVRRVTVMFNGVSTNGTALVQIQLGTSSGFVVSGYAGGSTFSSANGTNSTGLLIDYTGGPIASTVRTGAVSISAQTGTTWVSFGSISYNANTTVNSGSVTLGGVLDRIRITTVGGTDTFDAGSINIAWEF